MRIAPKNPKMQKLRRIIVGSVAIHMERQEEKARLERIRRRY